MTEPATPAAPDSADEPAFDEATVATLEALEEVLDELRERDEAVPHWEFCEGFLTGLLCTRREIAQEEWLLVLLPGEMEAADDADGTGAFESPGQRTRFLMHWLARETQLRAALEADVQDLNDPRALSPAVLDWRGMLYAAEADDRAPEGQAPAPEDAPSYAQMWAAGFLAVPAIWSDDWAPPRDKEIAETMADALDCLGLLVEHDLAPAAHNLFDDQAPPSVSEQRLNDFGEALWAVYDLHAIARALGPRIEPAQSDKVGRNDPCPCGSGKKYKKCCGA